MVGVASFFDSQCTTRFHIEISLPVLSLTTLYFYKATICVYRMTQNRIPRQTICHISATGGLILKILEAA